MTDFSFTAHNGHLSIPQGFVWEDIPEFAIVTGKNGTGKSQLLRCIESAIRTNKVSQYSKDNMACLNANTIFADRGNANTKISGGIPPSGIYKQIEDLIISPNSTPFLQISSNFVNELAITMGKPVSHVTRQDFLEYFPAGIINKFDNAHALKQWFRLYNEQRTIRLAREAEQENLNNIQVINKELPPWQIMNNILQKYGFKYTIKDFDPNLSPLQIEFTDGKLTVPIESLSSGEQQLIAFVSWAHHDVVSKNIKLLLLDEPDAHLHPSFCRIFIEIIQEYVVKKGIRVIMSTHSPSTVAFAPEDSIFVLNMPETEPRIKKQSKEEALNTLTDGLMHLSEGSLAAINIISSAEKGKKFLLCEGKTDVEHIETAINLFDDLSRVFLDIKIVPVGSASNYEVIIRFLRAAKVRQEDFLILVDGDKEGKDAITKMRNQHWISCIELTTKNIEKMTGLFEHSKEFKQWCLEQYPEMIDHLSPSLKREPSGKEQLLSSSFDKYIEAGECSNKIPNPLNRNTLEDADNVFKNLWVEYLKQNTEIAKQCYISLKDFLIENINFNS